jgi:iron complex transport system ATP-binding protein
METKNNILLSTSDLTIGYGNKLVLFENLNLALKASELICFMGPNGIGKSTLIRVLAGLQKPLSGQMRYGESLQSKDSHSISVVLTDKVKSEVMSVTDLVTFGRYPYLDWNLKLSNNDEEIILQSIRQLRIEHLVNKKLYELSDGQLQMVMVAKALAQDTPIILLDEPTAHLDLNNRVEIMNLLRGIARKTGKAIVIATHELDLALQTADTIWLTGKNKNILTGIPEDLILNDSFDAIFQFKGFDLKTGKIQHEPFRETNINLIGDGHALLWTKNAFERNGFNIVQEESEIRISIKEENGKFVWSLTSPFKQSEFDTLNALIETIK